MKIYQLFLPIILLLSGCGGGSSGSNGNNPFPGGNNNSVFTLDIAVLDENCQAVDDNSFTAGDSICVQAQLRENSNAASGQRVAFSVSPELGTLSASSRLTGDNGVAQIIISSDVNTVGASTITATFNDVTVTANYEFTPATVTPRFSLNLTLSDANCQAVANNSFTAGDDICVQARLLDNGIIVRGQPVNFTAGLGTLSAPSALTNDNGVATVMLNSEAANLGASVVTATYEDASASANYEYIPPTSSGRTLSLALLDANCEAVNDNSFTAGDSICVQARLLENGNAVAGQPVAFSAGLGTLTAQSALTNSNGIAQVILESEAANVGAAVLSATTNNITTNVNYEFTPPTNSSFTLSLTLLDENCEAVNDNSFTAGDSICLRAQLLENGNIVTGQPVTFSAGLGTLTAQSALTGSNGIAQVILESEAANVGASVVTATYNDATASANYEFTPPANSSGFVLSLSVLDENCNVVNDNSFTAGDTICVRANLQENGIASVGQRIDFSATLGTLSLQSKLTEANGIAQITISSNNSNVGASTITATFNNTSANANYEFLAAPIVTPPPPQIQISLLRNGNPINRFKAGEEVQLQARLLDANNNPIANNIITFSAASGTLATTTALTQNDGVAQVNMTAADADIGAAIASAQTTVDGSVYSNAMNYEIQPSTAVDQDNIQFGHFNSNRQFVPNQLGVSVQDAQGNVTIGAGATLGLSAALVDAQGNRVITPTAISFTSNCVANSLSTIDAQVTTINGEAFSTYQDVRCAGNSGNTDQIVASVVVGNNTLTLTRQIQIQAEDIGSISFISANPTNIVLTGTGGQNNQSVSTITFQVNGALGNPLSQQEVNFVLNTNAGGLTLSPSKGLTNSQGQVSTRVTAGNVPTAVRVTATTKNSQGTEIRTQSDLLSVNTGLPDQNSFSLATANFNPEAHIIDGTNVAITARLADSFNNPVPDGTTVNFTTEGGTIQPSCQTSAGVCSVTWTSSNPRSSDRRITILATAIGHETLFDRNGNNAYDNSDGGAIKTNAESGFGNVPFGQNGYHDMSEAWRDDDEDRLRDNSEIFIDYNNDGIYNRADDLFNGPQCTPGSNCGQGIQSSIHVRKALVMIMAGSDAILRVFDSSNNLIRSSSSQDSPTNVQINIARGATSTFRFSPRDDIGQVLPSGTSVTVTSTVGTIAGNTSVTIPSNNTARDYTFTLENDLTTADTSDVTITATLPSGVVRQLTFQINLQ